MGVEAPIDSSDAVQLSSDTFVASDCFHIKRTTMILDASRTLVPLHSPAIEGDTDASCLGLIRSLRATR